MQMVNGFMRTGMLVVGISTMLAGCSGMKVWPFGGDKTDELTGQPPNSTEYQCEGGKKFYVRMLDHGKTAWVILPLREVALAGEVSASGARYSNGITTLNTKGAEATLEDGPDNTYKACKATTKTTK
jgi:membrane-bound inhibitor of C-type lysozyme